MDVSDSGCIATILRPREYWLLSALGEVAWADGVLHAGEARLFLEIIGKLQLSKELASEVYRAVLTPDAPHQLDPTQLDDDDRRWILGFGYLMSAADGTVSDVEMNVLRDIARRLGVPWQKSEEIFHEADKARHIIGLQQESAS